MPAGTLKRLGDPFMFTNLSLRTKIFALVLGVVSVSFIVLTMIVSTRTYEMAKSSAFTLAQETADKYQNEIRAELQGARITAETLATVFGALKDIGKSDRETLDALLKNALANKEYITAFCVAYEINSLDGKDAELAKAEEEQWKEAEKKAEEAKKNGTADAKPEDFFTKRWDSSGRYAPYWNKLGDSIAVEPLLDKDITVADWWIVPQKTKAEFITDPYPYLVQGKDVMLESLIFPIIHNGKFIGIVSSDIVLDKLQEMVTAVNPNNEKGYTEIYSNNAAIAAHPDKRFLGKDAAEVILYELVTRIPEKIPAIIQRAEDYLAKNPVKDANNAEEKEAFEKLKKFAEQLKGYKENHDEQTLDLSLLTADFAAAMLEADAVRAKYAADIRECVKNGKQHIYHGHTFYTVYIPIKFSEVTTPWSVAVSVPMEHILSDARGIRNYVILASVIAFCFIAAMLFIVAGSITKPILKLANTAKIIGEGHFDAEVPLVGSKDEIGALSAAFKFMVGKINNLIKEMQGYANTLEEKNIYLNRLNELKDEFLANTSHELRTPINGIIGIVESMIDGATGSLSDEQKYNLAIVSNSGKRLSNMINDILDFTKLKGNEIELQLKPIDLKTIVDMVIVLSKPLIRGKELTLVSEIDDSLPPITADENRIQQILYNLIGNAVKFTDKGKVSVTATVNGDTVAVAVTDTGIGIAADKFDKIFESFEQADGSTAREYGGTGLGLSITKRIVELHGGTINVNSKVGEGSVFTFTVPKSSATREEAAAQTTSTSASIINMEDYAQEAAGSVQEKSGILVGSAAKGSGYRILVVDDEPVNIQVLQNLLSIRNYTVVKAHNGLEALDMFEKGETFDLVLLDVMMPKMSGYDVCKRLRNKYSLFDLPIIMLTAKNQIQDIVFGFQAGANDYIQKPFDKEELLARAKTMLELKGAMIAAMAANKAKGNFLANMSHELRTPLNAVTGLTDLLLKTPMNDRQRDYIEKMRDASASLLNIINNILDFSEVDSGKMKLERLTFDVKAMFSELGDYFRRQYPNSGVEQRLDFDAAIPSSLIGDPVRLKQVFINLLDNAYKFTEKGAITVRAAVGMSDPNNVMLNFAVEDTGVGMSQQQLKEVFTVFNQADNSATRRYGGVGIGLTITREMVELMGGKINVSSKEGEGTTFTFSCSFKVPEGVTVKSKPAAEEKQQSGSENAVLQGMHVLLAEDNKINAMIATELLKTVGVNVTPAVNGSEALDKLAEAVKTRRPAFDLVLMDLQMPVMDGYEATKIIKSTPDYKDIPVYALTAHAFAEERERCRLLGMSEHLTKPIDIEKFYAALRQAAPH
ncbi:MAG: response regulator [Planctomycetaceae bacterium]|jgi:signal transduction histidine kinase|nr:response regulator [Planctomycetaceae bacterium]